MVVRVAERASRVRNVNRILVATDSEEIVAVVKRAGFEAHLTPEFNSGTERVAYVAKDLREKIIVNLQGDVPVIAPEAVEAAIDPVRIRGCRMGSAFTAFRDWDEVLQPGNVKVLVDSESNAIYFSRYAIPFRQNALSDEEILKDPAFGKHLGIYSFQREFLLEFPKLPPPMIERAESLEQLRALHHGVRIGMGRTAFGGQSVDTAEDLEKARDIFRNRGSNG